MYRLLVPAHDPLIFPAYFVISVLTSFFRVSFVELSVPITLVPNGIDEARYDYWYNIKTAYTRTPPYPVRIKCLHRSMSTRTIPSFR